MNTLAPDASGAPPRVLSLDVFRGLTIAGMVLVNCPGNDHGYAFLRHAPWHGWTFADLIFPSFLVVMGLSVAVSLGRRRERGHDQPLLLRHVLRRAAVMFCLGLVVSLVEWPQLGVFRVPGVLQRIAVCFAACAFLFLKTGPGTQSLVCATLLVGYWLALNFIPAPGFPPGDLTPEGNLATFVDRWVFGRGMWTAAYDPEGILSTLPAIATALLGVLAGRPLLGSAPEGRKAAGLAAAGAACAAAGLLWGRWFPVNKNLWTSSYALFAGGTALAGLGACRRLLESRGLRAWGRPFEVLGCNALASYFLSEMLYGLQEFISVKMPDGTAGNLKLWICDKAFGRLAPPNAALAYSVAYLGLILGLMHYLRRREIFIRI